MEYPEDAGLTEPVRPYTPARGSITADDLADEAKGAGEDYSIGESPRDTARQASATVRGISTARPSSPRREPRS